MAQTPARAESTSSWVDPPAKSEAKDTQASTKQERTPSQTANRPSAQHAHRVVEHRHRDVTRRYGHRPTTPPSEIDTTPDPRFTDWAGQAQRLTSDYLDSVSARNDAMLASAPRFYGNHVRFHGRSMSLAALMADKRRFVQRWPERRYKPQSGAMRTTCSAASATCVVHTIFGFQAENPARGARSQGLSELTLAVSFAGEHPVIVSETSRVLRRGRLAFDSAERGGGA
ncbi:hypothetical protein HCU64_05345 [Methylobacterium sp. C25]|uniref:hypothetical protein n=1 Tax=Methylobacterium sp. C25 TaxID=2721622 RepID=UPI001F2BD70B|nr:hypothetical protein [Methylobacterium sp. C25]MCE4223167.1 hypothetical protein [Methylobacterium sp. C25]